MKETIALTYDDGPDPLWTPRILAALARRGARATFFVQARRAIENPDLIESILAAGSEVGFHCVDHVRHSERPREAVVADLETGLELLDEVGVRPRAWRAPWGVETDATRALASSHDLRLWGWNLDTHDWRGDGARRMLKALDAQGGLRGGDVILMHDALGPGARRGGCAETVALTELLLGIAEGSALTPAGVSGCEGVLA
ncbi:MAG: polysaccharide deacetylase family protein [Actinobacteria bacterium]|nr:polysaccharide deacetylase family protein [Actinomycetota bacterium]